MSAILNSYMDFALVVLTSYVVYSMCHHVDQNLELFGESLD